MIIHLLFIFLGTLTRTTQARADGLFGWTTLYDILYLMLKSQFQLFRFMLLCISIMQWLRPKYVFPNLLPCLSQSFKFCKWLWVSTLESRSMESSQPVNLANKHGRTCTSRFWSISLISFSSSISFIRQVPKIHHNHLFLFVLDLSSKRKPLQ